MRKNDREEVAGFWDRLLAATIDIAPIVLFAVLFVSFAGLLAKIYDERDGSPVLAALLFLGFPIWWSALCISYSAYCESSKWQGTLGKRAIGIRVVGLEGERLTFGRSTARAFAKMLSAVPAFLGVFAITVSDEKAAWHDSICRTRVLRDRQRYWLRENGMKKKTTINIGQHAQGVVVQVADEMKDVAAEVKQESPRRDQALYVTDLLKQLELQIGEVAVAAKTSDAQRSARRMSKELKRLQAEISEEEPDSKWYEVTLTGIKEAAQAIGAIANPVAATVAKLLPLLLGSGV